MELSTLRRPRVAGSQEALMTFVRLIARPMLASSFVASGTERFRHAESGAAALRPVLDTVAKVFPAAARATADEQRAVRVLGAVQATAGVLLAMGRFSRLCSAALAVTSALQAFADFRSADSSTPEARKSRRVKLLKDISLTGAVLLAAVDTNGQPGLAWRAGHLAHGTRRKLQKADRSVRKTASGMVG
jgi:uncharacterized membrane protein YphA (DoxX/SURF4 family)